jgi:hypothetical protein
MLPPPRITLANVTACLCLVFLAPASFAQFSKQAIPYKSQELFQRQISWDENSPSEKNPKGLFFQFSKTDETTSSGKRVVLYRAYVFGAPENKKYTLTVWRLGTDPHTLSVDVYVNAKGLLMTHKPRPEQENSDFVGDAELHIAVQAARAEPVRYAFASSDKALLVYGTVVPFPLTDTDRDCQLEVRLAQPDATVVLIYADGLRANAEIPFQLLSAGQPETGKFSVNAQGHAVTTAIPALAGTESNSLRVTLTTPECSVAIALPWGKGSSPPQ